MRLQLTILTAAVLAPTVTSSDSPWSAAVDTLVYTDTDRVLVVSPQAAVHRALDTQGGEISARGAVDVVSAASVDVVSQATVRFQEVRTTADLSAAKAFGDHLPSLALHFSNEPDYLSGGGNIGWQSRLGSPESVLSLGYGLTHDLVGRHGTPTSVFSETLTSHSGNASFTQVIGRRSLARLAYTLTVQSGYLEKPYRYVPLFTAESARDLGEGTVPIPEVHRLRPSTKPPEEVPDLRVAHAIGLRAMHYVSALRASG